MSKITRPRILAPERQRIILDLVNNNGSMTIEEICQKIDISPSTIRRDLDKLGSEHRIVRIHGGATSVNSKLIADDSNFIFDERANVQIKEKQAIARLAASYIEDHETIFIDGGSTLLELAKAIKHNTTLNVITTSIRAAFELTKNNGPRVIMVGGEIRAQSQDIIDTNIELLLKDLFLNKAFFGANTITTTGMTTTDETSQSIYKQLVARYAQKNFVLIDSTKFGNNGFFIANKPEDIDMYITDSNLSPENRQYYENNFHLNIRYAQVD